MFGDNEVFKMSDVGSESEVALFLVSSENPRIRIVVLRVEDVRTILHPCSVPPSPQFCGVKSEGTRASSTACSWLLGCPVKDITQVALLRVNWGML